jgi:deoxyadenosine/deoxycytidine kinase
MAIEQRSPVIAIEGTIGAGKSTLCRWIRKNLGGAVIDEAASSLHADYAADPERWGFTYQMALLTQRARTLRQAHNHSLKCEGPIWLDRSTLGERAFGEANRRVGRLSAIEYDIWERAFGEYNKLLDPPDITVFLDVDCHTASERAILRDGGGDAVDREYMIELQYAYERGYEDLKSRGACCLKVPWGQDYAPHQYSVHADILVSRIVNEFNDVLIEHN